MKKVILGTALLAMIVAPMTAAADTTLYGRMRYSFSLVDEDGGGGGADGIQGRDNTSYLGVKGTYGDSLKAFFNLQTGAPADGNGGVALNQRFYFAGLQGGFGKLAYGLMTNVYKAPGAKMDAFCHFSHTNAAGMWAPTGVTHGLSPATNGFTDNSLQYVSPSIAGLKLAAGVYVEDSNEDDHAYAADLSYSIAGLTAGGAIAMTGDTATLTGLGVDGDAYRLYAMYKADSFKAGVSYENVDTGGVDTNYIYLTATAMVPAANMEFRASLGMVDEGAAEGESLNVGAFYSIAPNTKLFAILGFATLDSDSDPYSFSLGAEHKFSLSSK